MNPNLRHALRRLGILINVRERAAADDVRIPNRLDLVHAPPFRRTVKVCKEV